MHSNPLTVTQDPTNPSSIGIQPRYREGYQPAAQRYQERLLARAGAFRTILEEYLATKATLAYKPQVLRDARRSLIRFFQFIVEQEAIESTQDIKPSHVSHYLISNRQKGLGSTNDIGKISRFFDWAVQSGHMDEGNPIIPCYHRAIAAGLAEPVSIEEPRNA